MNRETRRFELRDGKSSKFWTITISGNSVVTAWGRIGADGQNKTKDLADSAAAQKEVAKQTRAKKKKGYVEIVTSLEPAPSLSSEPLPVGAVRSGKGLILGFGSDGGHVVAVGGQGRAIYLSSLDGGKTFVTKVHPGRGLRGVVVQGEEVWVCGEWGYIAQSLDGGTTWTDRSIRADPCLFGIVADDANTLWVAGDDSYIGRSTNRKTFRSVRGVDNYMGRIAMSPLGVLIPTDAPGALFIGKGTKVRPTSASSHGDYMKATVTPQGTLLAACVIAPPMGERHSRVSPALARPSWRPSARSPTAGWWWWARKAGRLSPSMMGVRSRPSSNRSPAKTCGAASRSETRFWSVVAPD